jgi:hypothetical protein
MHSHCRSQPSSRGAESCRGIGILPPRSHATAGTILIRPLLVAGTLPLRLTCTAGNLASRPDSRTGNLESHPDSRTGNLARRLNTCTGKLVVTVAISEGTRNGSRTGKVSCRLVVVKGNVHVPVWSLLDTLAGR